MSGPFRDFRFDNAGNHPYQYSESSDAGASFDIVDANTLANARRLAGAAKVE